MFLLLLLRRCCVQALVMAIVMVDQISHSEAAQKRELKILNLPVVIASGVTFGVIDFMLYYTICPSCACARRTYCILLQLFVVVGQVVYYCVCPV